MEAALVESQAKLDRALTAETDSKLKCDELKKRQVPVMHPPCLAASLCKLSPSSPVCCLLVQTLQRANLP